VRLADPATDAGALSPALLLPIFRSEAQAWLLAELFVEPDPEREYSLAELGLWTNVLSETAHREISDLVEAGLLWDRHVESGHYVRVTSDVRRHPLVELGRMSYGAKPLLERGLRDIQDVEAAYLFGPWATRYRGVRGFPVHDVGLLLIGSPDAPASPTGSWTGAGWSSTPPCSTRRRGRPAPTRSS
jgi:hypothetical protein